MSQLLIGNTHLRETEVSQFDVTKFIDEDVFWLEVPMDDLDGVEVLDC